MVYLSCFTGEVFLFWGLLPSWINTQLHSSLLLLLPLFHSLSLSFSLLLCASWQMCARVPQAIFPILILFHVSYLHLYNAFWKIFSILFSSLLIFLLSCNSMLHSLSLLLFNTVVFFFHFNITFFHFQNFYVVLFHIFLFLFHYLLFLFYGI